MTNSLPLRAFSFAPMRFRLSRIAAQGISGGFFLIILHTQNAVAAQIGPTSGPTSFYSSLRFDFGSIWAVLISLLAMSLFHATKARSKNREAELEAIITNQESALTEAVEKMNYRLRFETMVTSLAKRFIALNPNEIDAVILDALAEIGQFCQVDRCYIFRFSDDGKLTSNVHEWCAEGIEAQIDNLQNIPVELCPWLMKHLWQFKSVSIPVVEDLPQEACSEKELFVSQSIQSVLLVPIVLRSELIGFLGFDAVKSQKSWREEDQISLQMVTEIFAMAWEKSRAEQELSESRHFRTIAEAAPIPVIISRLQDSEILYANQEAATILGIPRDKIIGQSALSFYQQQNDREKLIEQIGKENSVSGYALQIRTPDKHVAHVQLSIRRLLYEGEEAIISGIYDITQRIAVEQALRESEERFRQLADHIDEVFWLSDPAKKHMYYVSPGFEKIWGRSCESLYNNPRSWFYAIHDDERGQVMEASLTIDSTNSYSEIYRIRRPDGSMRWIRDRAFPIRDQYGQIYRVAGVAEDITEMKRAEEKIARLEKQKLEIEKHAATGRMAARVAHEINNPLAGIKNAFSLIRGGIDPGYRHYDLVDKIEHEIDRIAKIVRQMYDLYRPTPDLSREFDINDTVRDVVTLLKVSSQELNIPLQLDLQSEHLKVFMPEALVRQVLFNLIQNAIEASERESPVGIRTSADNMHFEIAIIDHGTGISAEVETKIFEPFFTTKDGLKTGGLGLGLSISKSIVESLQGTLSFENNETAGTTVRIRLPLASKKGGMDV